MVGAFLGYHGTRRAGVAGEGNPFKGENQYIHLDQYCIENCLLDIDLASEVLGRSKEEIKDKILNSIKKNREKILKKNKYLEFLFDGFEVTHITPEQLGSLDGSVIIEPFLAEFDITFQDYLEKYVSTANQNGQLETVFPVQLIEAMR